MKKISLLIVLVIFSLTSVLAQSHAVYGVINTLDSIPLIGVDVAVKSTKQTVKTDSLGKFSVICADKDKLKISAKGFYTENIKITPDIKLVAINMKLKPGEKQREYAIGYGYVSEANRTGAILAMDNKDTRFSRYKDMFDLIRSMGAEVRGRQVIIRGSKSFQGSSAALIVVDGSIVDYDFLNTIKPIDVERIDILKDAAASSYGSRGANGVVLIETLKGK